MTAALRQLEQVSLEAQRMSHAAQCTPPGDERDRYLRHDQWLLQRGGRPLEKPLVGGAGWLGQLSLAEHR